ncbi:diguanylate cyclase [Ruegeria marina]|uniref:diguanylate cyclase n=1 Tax=Ruegeria marina TaxID=639004 RepID=A0A1G6VEX7_9RHOB|nr:diguanylate cyclase [Ruegeria marina]SDD51557.1 response regulator receiver modulated diguanylate cyclase [Ruegeria marina]
MQGTILFLDGVSTNRIMLKVQLAAAWYHVIQSDRIEGVVALVGRVRPDLILCAMTLPDGSATDVKRVLAKVPGSADIPMIAIAAHAGQPARLKALAAGIDDVMTQPYDDMLLLARIRSLIRARSRADELRQQGNLQGAGLEEVMSDYLLPPRRSTVALIAQTPGTGAIWRARLKGQVPHDISLFRIEDVQTLLSVSAPDVILIELSDGATCLRLLADLRARSNTRNAAIIAIPSQNKAHLASDALDRGADDVMSEGFEANELALRLEALLRRKSRTDMYLANLRARLDASLTDPMTGLFNRRHAMPELHRIVRDTFENDQEFSLLLLDIDHFKSINDRFGHPAGDAVLIETAERLKRQLRPTDLLARIGGEEFMVVRPGVSGQDAMRMAGRLCACMNSSPFALPAGGQPVQVTVSIGLAVLSAAGQPAVDPVQIASQIFAQADRALYMAKEAGRNRISTACAA